MRLLFSLRSINYDRHFEGLLRELLGRGHEVHVVLDIFKKGRQGDDRLFRALQAEHPAFTWDQLPRSTAPHWEAVALRMRLASDYLRYLEPEYADADALRGRVRERTSSAFVMIAERGPLAGPNGRRRLNRALLRLEAGLPISEELREHLRARDPDVVLISPLVGLGSPQGDLLRAARSLGLPTALVVASWDNLTNKGVLRDVPDLTVVWSPAQVEEAVRLHKLPRESVLATGAHTYDHWFSWSPSTSREQFAAEAGLDPRRPWLLYVGSSAFIAPDEADFAFEWIKRLRNAPDPALREAGVLVRPHPANAQAWEQYGVLDDPHTAVWPPNGEAPTTVGAKSSYYDSIHHAAAVIGINTSALIESAIVGRPVFTLTNNRFRSRQEGTLHFAHLASGDGGLLNVARTWEEHHSQLAGALAEPGHHAARSHSFLESFVRPQGVEHPAAPRVAEAIEALVRRRTAPSASPAHSRLVRALDLPLWLALRMTRRLTANPVRPAPRASGVTAVKHLCVLLVLDHPGLLMHFDETVRELVRRGHRVTLGFGRPGKFPVGLASLADLRGRVEVELHAVPRRKDPYAPVARQVRASLDTVHYLDPSHAGARYSRRKWARNPALPALMRALVHLGPLPAGAHRVVQRVVLICEEAIPSDARTERWLARRKPDLLIVSPLVQQDAYQTDYLKSARALNIPSVLSVASWDNLSSKGYIRTPPDLVTVWNQTQAEEAIRLHAVAPERIVVTGAQPFDRWFGRLPGCTAAELRVAHSLPAGRPYVLFVGSTRQGTKPGAEAGFVRDWIAALRSSDDPLLRDIAVLVRPHPTAVKNWAVADFSDLGDVAIWRRETPLPVLEDERAAYFDSLYHAAAVMGINSSAMVEAAIVGRPVHTVLLPKWAAMQGDLVHFRYLLPENGGFLRAADSLAGHLALLGTDLRDEASWRPAQERFVASFVRPRGVDHPALPYLVDALERAARSPEADAPALSPSLLAVRCVLRLRAAAIRLRGELLGRMMEAARVGVQPPPKSIGRTVREPADERGEAMAPSAGHAQPTRS